MRLKTGFPQFIKLNMQVQYVLAIHVHFTWKMLVFLENQVTHQKRLACTSYKIPQDQCPLSPDSAASSVSPSSIILLSSSQYLRQWHHLQTSSLTLHDTPHHLLFQKTFSPINVQPRTQPSSPG